MGDTLLRSLGLWRWVPQLVDCFLDLVKSRYLNKNYLPRTLTLRM